MSIAGHWYSLSRSNQLILIKKMMKYRWIRLDLSLIWCLVVNYRFQCRLNAKNNVLREKFDHWMSITGDLYWLSSSNQLILFKMMIKYHWIRLDLSLIWCLVVNYQVQCKLNVKNNVLREKFVHWYWSYCSNQLILIKKMMKYHWIRLELSWIWWLVDDNRVK